jgi:hypothetical protein
MLDKLRQSKERTLWIAFGLFMVTLIGSLGACGAIK